MKPKQVKHQLTIYLDEDTHAKVVRQAEEETRAIGNMVLVLIKRAVNDNRKEGMAMRVDT